MARLCEYFAFDIYVDFNVFSPFIRLVQLTFSKLSLFLRLNCQIYYIIFLFLFFYFLSLFKFADDFFPGAVIMDEPRFAQPIPNVTVAVGRDANLPCVVEHLGAYKVCGLFIYLWL